MCSDLVTQAERPVTCPLHHCRLDEGLVVIKIEAVHTSLSHCCVVISLLFPLCGRKLPLLVALSVNRNIWTDMRLLPLFIKGLSAPCPSGLVMCQGR